MWYATKRMAWSIAKTYYFHLFSASEPVIDIDSAQVCGRTHMRLSALHMERARLSGAAMRMKLEQG